MRNWDADLLKKIIKLHLLRPPGRRVVAIGETLWYEIPGKDIEDLISFINAHCVLWNAQDNDDEDDDVAEVEELLREVVNINSL